MRGKLRIVLLTACGLGGCVPLVPDATDANRIYNNMTDPSNGGASYLGSAACATCHARIAASFSLHAHGHSLTKVQGEASVYPPEATRADVPQPPEGLEWTDISYVLGGYRRKAVFLDESGFLITSTAAGEPTQWNLAFPPSATIPGFVNFESSGSEPLSFDYTCFRCHTTGPTPFDPDNPQFHDNRPGIRGTWKEDGVQCEACHGPGSNHIPRPEARDLFVDLSADACGVCHTRESATVIRARDGFIESYQQRAELLASGGHSGFRCINCHEPHRSPGYDRANAFNVQCTGCHVTQNMAIHEGKVLSRQGYREELSCVSCHMPFASRSAGVAGEGVVGTVARVADLRTHIFRIDPSGQDFHTMFTEDGTAVRKDASGRAAMTIDFICLRCHNGLGSAFELTLQSAASIARGIHQIE